VERLLRAALVVGAIVDASVALLSIFFQPLLGPLLDVPTRDPALTTIAGGEFALVALLYIFILRDVEKYRALLWLVALDQVLAIVLPGIEMLRGHFAVTFKTIGPMPLNAILAAIFLAGLRRPNSAGQRNRYVR
jgi:hypothetical protein